MRFDAMRANLIKRGLLDPERRLTPAGHAYVDNLIRDLKRIAHTKGELQCPTSN